MGKETSAPALAGGTAIYLTLDLNKADGGIAGGMQSVIEELAGGRTLHCPTLSHPPHFSFS